MFTQIRNRDYTCKNLDYWWSRTAQYCIMFSSFENMVFAASYFFNKTIQVQKQYWREQHLKRSVYQSIDLNEYFHMNTFEESSSSFAYHSISCQHSVFPPKVGWSCCNFLQSRQTVIYQYPLYSDSQIPLVKGEKKVRYHTSIEDRHL